MVDHLALRTATRNFSRSLPSCFVVVEEKVNGLMPLQERNGLVEISHRVKHNDIEGKGSLFLKAEIGKEIHKALEYQHLFVAVVDGRNVFGGAAALEMSGAELSSVTVVLEADGEIRIAVCPVVYFTTIVSGDAGVYAPLLDVADKGRVFERPNVEDLNARFPGLSVRNGWRSLNA